MTSQPVLQSILVVDDEPNIREIVGLYLERAGFQVRLAGDGPTALQALTASLPDLVILDVMLPGVDGLEITRRLRSELNFLRPIIAVTACAMKGDQEKCLAAGADEYVMKPFTRDAVLDKLNLLGITPP